MSAHAASDAQICFYDVPIGKKAVMATTGVVLLGYVIGHLAGNLQIYAGPEAINDYGAMLHSKPLLLWGTRTLLLVSFILHVGLAVHIALLRRAARPLRYVKYRPAGSDYASRTMIWSGVILLAFVAYHLMHFTFGNAHPDFVEGDIYHNVITGFQSWPVSASYIVAMIFLGLHLYHGFWSMFQSVGLVSPRLLPKLRRTAQGLAFLIAAGNISIPVAVLAGLVRS